MTDYKDLVQKCEGHIRRGEAKLAIRQLHALNAAKVPREWRLPLANLCRRLRLVSLGIRLLNPVVRSEGRELMIASPAETTEYAMLMLRNGSTNEALATIGAVDEKRAPEALYCKASCLVSRWNYADARVHLERYRELVQSPYQALIAEINLAAVMIATEDFSEAIRLLDDLSPRLKEGGHLRLYANGLELRAQVYVEAGDFARARRELEVATGIFGESPTADGLYIQKWLAVTRALEAKSAAPLTAFREQALARADWESVRETDLFSLVAEFNEDKFHFLIFGTPFAPYRARIERKLSRHVFARTYDLGGARGAPFLDIGSGEISGHQADLKPGCRHHQLLETLSRDFYAPISTGGLFGELFPDEYFNPESSPLKVRQTISRCRKWLAASGIGLKIKETRGFYALGTTPDFTVRVPFERRRVEGYGPQVERLKRAFQTSFFSARSGRELLDMPLTTFRSLLDWALAQGLIQKTGAGSATLYKIAGAPDGLGRQAA